MSLQVFILLLIRNPEFADQGVHVSDQRIDLLPCYNGEFFEGAQAGALFDASADNAVEEESRRFSEAFRSSRNAVESILVYKGLVVGVSGDVSFRNAPVARGVGLRASRHFLIVRLALVPEIFIKVFHFLFSPAVFVRKAFVTAWVFPLAEELRIVCGFPEDVRGNIERLPSDERVDDAVSVAGEIIEESLHRFRPPPRGRSNGIAGGFRVPSGCFLRGRPLSVR